ncbi:FUSC family protein [Sanguibacter suaedae]|uniref:FUSC family protein n=1 Tax=Sanguibacter suaedae TaxID=2795737 RepID=A0A934MAF1_9MICO|nr:hypothetical protein [Sanguibacter suaedae]MBI9115693.1 hypothetical protein [Sanguibacter suaedae]
MNDSDRPRDTDATTRRATLRRAVATARTTWNRHPRWGLAVRATVAAVIAFPVALLVPEPWSAYPYYAPLGAVVATSVTLASSARESAQAVGAILLGAAVAQVVDLLVPWTLPSLALVVLVGVALSGLRVLGGLGSWVPTSALFVLIVGDADPVGYTGAYIGLTFVGAVIGILVNAVKPPLPLTPATFALHDLRKAVVAQLDDLGDALVAEERPGPDEWLGHQHDLVTVARQVDDAVARATEAAEANWAARRHAAWRAHQSRQSRLFVDLTHRVAELTGLVVESERSRLRSDPLDGDLRTVTARTFRDVARAVEAADRLDGDADAYDAARRAVDDLETTVGRVRVDPSREPGAAVGITLALSRVVDTLTEHYERLAADDLDGNRG